MGGMGVLGTRDVMVGGSRLHGGPARLGEVRPGGNTAVGYSEQRAATALPGRSGMGWFLMFVPPVVEHPCCYCCVISSHQTPKKAEADLAER